MRWRVLKYAAVFVLPLFTVVSFSTSGWLTYSPLLFGFVLLPLLEFAAGKSELNLKEVETELVRTDTLYNVLIYLTIPTQIFFTLWFVIDAADNAATASELVGRTLAMGLMNGVFGVNIAHELGHRNTMHERLMAKVMLASTLFLHFFIEHNRGHHRNVCTPLDPASARRNESLYAFWMRTVCYSFLSAWSIVKKERERRNQNVWSLSNEMIQYLLLQILIVLLVAFTCSSVVLVCFLLAALIGWLLLETVNYIEHYGLERKKLNEHRYEDVRPLHSWNSDYIIGRVVLFELTRHSDHHYNPEKPYQTLHSLEHSSQLPAGYPAMMLLALLPQAWFHVMNKRLPS
ncbi:MAG: alkane 1-monooxygenase [Flavobacteriales bacterium]